MDQMKDIWKDLSLRKSIVVYITVFTGLAILLCMITISLCDFGKKQIDSRYSFEGEVYYLTNAQGQRLGEGTMIGTGRVPMTKEDEIKVTLLDGIRVICVPVYSALCIIGAALLFYRNRLKRPLELLTEASRKIAENDLEFCVFYDRTDELGALCASFETMRSALYANISEMGRQMEERKRLNAAFAHDLRTPLTVLKGYDEILQTSEDEQTRKITATMGKHIDRLAHYIESMSRLRRLEDASPEYQSVISGDFEDSLRECAQMLCMHSGKKMHMESHLISNQIIIDGEFVSQVCINLISNAVRFAESLVTFTLEEMKNGILLSVTDDGKGFEENSLQYALEPYYTEDENHFEHFGLGLYICKILCEHHGGTLTIQNVGKGAKATAFFKFGVR